MLLIIIKNKLQVTQRQGQDKDLDWNKRQVYISISESGPPLTYNCKSSHFADICVRTAAMPRLRSLDLRATYAARLIEADILELLRGLPDLKKVIFPEFYLMPTIVSELSWMKHIKIIKDSFVPVLKQGAPPVLSIMMLYMHICICYCTVCAPRISVDRELPPCMLCCGCLRVVVNRMACTVHVFVITVHHLIMHNAYKSYQFRMQAFI
jgi:hypothetical protein